ncbi:MAG TPA: hypothetical protein VMV54_02780 [Acidocella sp.]|nr:hypothetical protein [Acidocella sp.]
MALILDYPLVVFVFSLTLLYVSEESGAFLGKRRGGVREGEREDFNLIMSALLTLLALIIGFTLSMAISHYDQRKSYEEAEANAISTEYLRADLLPVADTARVHELLVNYLDQRILFYNVRILAYIDRNSSSRLQQINDATDRLETELWSTVEVPSVKEPTVLTQLAISGVNDVINSRGYTQSAWWNRIPTAAWCLMAIIAVLTNVLIGYGMRRAKETNFMRLIFPLIISVSFFLISDIDSPRSGIIRVSPENLISLAQLLHVKN